jgi:SulP family sulfate permease
LHLPTLAIGTATIALIVVLERTRLGSIGLVVAVVATSALSTLLGWQDVATLNDLGEVPRSLPSPMLINFTMIPLLIIPALSLAFVGLVQGASITASYPNPDESFPDASGDFVGQGVANIASGIFQGMPVGGSVSASALNKAAGARSRQSLIAAGIVMALVILIFGRIIGYVAMPALAGLLMLIGLRTIKPHAISTVWRTGSVQKAVFVITFALTMLIPLQYAVLVGVGVSVILHIVRQSNQVTIKRRITDSDGHLIETDPPATVPAGEVVVLQPYGSLFFAAAPVFESQLPAVDHHSRGSVVILRLRGRTDLGTTFMDVLVRYAQSLRDAGSRLMIVSTNEEIEHQLRVSGLDGVVGADGIYRGDERVGAAISKAVADAQEWVGRQQEP